MAVKAPTPPTKPTPPSLDGNNYTPEVQMDSNGPSVPSGELHTPAERFGVHINIGGSEAVQKNFSNEAEPAEEAEPANLTVEQKAKADAKAKTKSQTGKEKTGAKDGKAGTSQDAKGNQEKADEQAQTSTVPFYGGGSDEKQTQEGSLKVAPHDDGIFDSMTGGHVSYWPFLLVFVVAFASFVVMNFMKRREGTGFEQTSYKEKTAEKTYSTGAGENMPKQQDSKKAVRKAAAPTDIEALLPEAKPVRLKPKNDDKKSHFEIRI